MKTSDRVNGPDRLEKKWGDREDPNDHLKTEA